MMALLYLLLVWVSFSLFNLLVCAVAIKLNKGRAILTNDPAEDLAIVVWLGPAIIPISLLIGAILVIEECFPPKLLEKIDKLSSWIKRTFMFPFKKIASWL